MADDVSLMQWAFRWVGRVAFWLLIFAVVLLAADWGVWRLRVWRGGGVDSVEVKNVTVVPLKGNKEEYYHDGNSTVECSRSLFPQGGDSACWWLRRHREVVDRI